MPDYIRNFVLLQETFQLESIGQNPKSLQHPRYVSLIYFDLTTEYTKFFGHHKNGNHLFKEYRECGICECTEFQ